MEFWTILMKYNELKAIIDEYTIMWYNINNHA